MKNEVFVEKGEIRYRIDSAGFTTISLEKVQSVEVVKKSSFRHPVVGLIFAGVSFFLTFYFLIVSAARGAIINLFMIPKGIGTSILFLFFFSVFILWELYHSKRIPWLLIETDREEHLIPINDETMQEVVRIFEAIKNRIKSE